MQKITMTFTCNQSWEDMTIAPTGRFCEVCQKCVHDFTSKSIHEIRKLGKDNELCGMFLEEQVDPNLYPIDIPHRQTFLKFAFTIGALVGLNFAEAKAGNPKSNAHIEAISRSTSSSNTFNANPVIDFQPLEINDEPLIGNVKPKPQKKKFYFSRRFPFIVRRHIKRTIGRYRF